MERGKARLGEVRFGGVWQGEEQGEAWYGRVRRGTAWRGVAWLGEVWQGTWHGWARLGVAL